MASGQVFEPVIKADATMTLALPKEGFMNSKFQNYIGEIYLADISVPPELYQRETLRIDVNPIFNKCDIVRLR